MNKKLFFAVLVVFLAIGLSAMLIMIREDKAENSVELINPDIIPINDNSLINNNPTINNSSNSSITLQELSTHSSVSNCWVIYNNKVYDLTNFLPKHPGSAAAILPYCGTQGFQKAFTSQHGTAKVSMLMKVGILMGDFKIVGNSA